MTFHFTALEASQLCLDDYANARSLENVAVLEGTARVVRHKGILVCVCQGTTTALDWISNVRILPRRVRAELLSYLEDDAERGATLLWHRGFLHEAQSIWTWLHKQQITPDVFTGHSRGGGVGQVLAYSYCKPGLFFASPNALSPKNKGVPTSENVWHIRNYTDVVTRIPIGWWLYGCHEQANLDGGWRISARHVMSAYRAGLESGRARNIAVEVRI